MKLKWIEKKYSAEETTFIMYCLGIIAGCGIFSAIIRNLTLCYRLGKDDTPDFIWQILPENVTLLSLLICGVLMILMMRNVRRKQVFIQQNANLIAGIGFSLEVNGLVLMTLHYLSPASSDGSQQYLIFMLIGVFFLFINCLFKLGIQMQEEQDLTV